MKECDISTESFFLEHKTPTLKETKEKVQNNFALKDTLYGDLAPLPPLFFFFLFNHKQIKFFHLREVCWSVLPLPEA